MALIDNVSALYKRIYHAAMRVGRSPDDVRLVAVSKTMEAERVREAVDAGLRVFGESRVQEAVAKAEALAGLPVTWHLVGHLQKNKARAAVGLFDLIHSVDSGELLALIGRCAKERGMRQRVLLQVNLSGEEQKFGMDEGDMPALVREARALGSVIVEGLMTITPFFDEPELARPYYRRLRELAAAAGLPHLSMGMTGDFEVAIEEGATLIRVGTAIFGERAHA